MELPEPLPDGRLAERMDLDEWEHREVYASFGVTIYYCQVLESSLVNYIAFLRLAETGTQMTREELDLLLESLFGQTLGRNLRELRRILGDDTALAAQMDDVLTLRNELIHHWLRRRAGQWGTHAKREQMALELVEARGRLQEASDLLVSRTLALEPFPGLRSTIEEEYREMIARSERDEPEEELRPG